MSRETDPEILRERANRLLRKAKEMEEKTHIKIGQLVDAYYGKDFQGFDMETFKKEVEAILKPKKRAEPKAEMKGDA